MPLLLAPYNSAMRLGSGFNSYTQQLCVNNAVIKDNSEPATSADLRILPGGKDGETSQSVTWTANFVDKASEVMESLNISGSLAIKFGLSGGGRGEGAYLNTDKMKESDINYLFQVRVINQRLVGQEVTKFNNIPNLPRGNFTDIYGDCFISGFLEGGEFNALMSMKIHDKSARTKASGQIAADFRAGALTVNAEARGDWEKSDMQKNSTTSISVSWTGGGNIRAKDDRGKEWTMASMQAAAITFPEKVAEYPQYTHAILTKYASLRSYQELTNKGTPLDYENAGVYTSSLLDAYMEYKLVWSDITNMARSMQQNLIKYQTRTDGGEELAEYATESQQDFDQRIRAYYGPENVPSPVIPPKAIAEPESMNQEVIETQNKLVKMQTMLAKVEHALMVAAKKSKLAEQGDLSDRAPLKPNALKPYPATLIGFDRARRDCRWEMIKIVREVDEVTKDPTVATDPNRTWVYLSPIIFRQLLPKLEIEFPPYTQEWVDKDREANAAMLKAKQTELDNTKATLSTTEQTLKDERVITTNLRTANEAKDQRIQDLQGQVAVLNTTSELKAKFSTLGIKSRLSVQRWGVMVPKSTSIPYELTARYNITYSSVPTFLYAVCDIRGYALEPDYLHPPSFSVDDAAIRKVDGADLRAGEPWSRAEVNNLEYSWMASPSELIVDFGDVRFDDDIDPSETNSSATKEVTFTNQYSEAPKVAVWCTSLSWRDCPANPNARSRGWATDITTTGFQMNIETWGDSTHAGAHFGWCAWEAGMDGIKVVSEVKTWGTKDLTGDTSSVGGKTEYWEPDFKGKLPLAILTGFSGFDVDISETRTFHLECKHVGDLGPNSLIRYGPDSTTKARWADFMYIAILED